jgi:hypothetical protein
VKVRVKQFTVDMEIKTSGIELEVRKRTGARKSEIATSPRLASPGVKARSLRPTASKSAGLNLVSCSPQSA